MAIARRAGAGRLRAPVALIVLFALSALAACSSMRVEVEVNEAFDFAASDSYAWYQPPSPPPTGTAVALREDLEQRLVARVDERLREGGFDAQDPATADLRLRYRMSMLERLEFNDPFYAHDRSSTFEQGSLILEFVDADTGEPVWRGVASARLSEDTKAERIAVRLDEAVDRILARFPPR